MLVAAEDRMKKSIDALLKEFAKVRTGQANPAVLESVYVDYYGTATPIPQVAAITVPDSRTLAITPWEKTMMTPINKAILASNIGLNPMPEGSMIRIVLPPLTEERRRDLAKLCKNIAEDARVAIRNIRRDANDGLKKQAKDESLSQDQEKKVQEQVQKLTDKYIAKVEELLVVKEKEILTV